VAQLSFTIKKRPLCQTRFLPQSEELDKAKNLLFKTKVIVGLGLMACIQGGVGFLLNS
jgi:hypothetical protein